METQDNPVLNANPDGQRYPFAPAVDRWLRVFTAAKEDRKVKFDQWADEAMNFFDGPASWMWDQVGTTLKANRQTGDHQGWLRSGVHMPQFRMSMNRLFEAVALFGPALYHQNPVVAVTPRQLPEVGIDAYYATNEQASELVSMIPAMQQGMVQDDQAIQMAVELQQQYSDSVEQSARHQTINDSHAEILEALSNYCQQEGNKRDESRMAITEAIITGLGLLEVRVEQPKGGGPKTPCCRYRTNKDLLVDPDATYWRDVTWIALRTVAPANIVEEKFGLPPKTLRGRYARQAALKNKSGISQPRDGNNRITNATHDLVEYWEVYSKNGAGQHIKLNDRDPDMKGLDAFGDFVYLAICKGVKYPLNLNPWLFQQGDEEAVLDAAAWEVPYWDDFATDGGWPICRLSFYDKPGQVWPISMVKPCIAELRFVNWCMSFIADKVAIGSKIYVGTMKEAGESIRSQLLSGDSPFTVLELEKISGKSVNDLISFQQAPDFSIDIWKMLVEVNEAIDKRLGLTELVYGMTSKQMRSAAEANNRNESISIRPDDMANRVEDWLSTSAIREIQAYRFTCEYEDVLPILGVTASQVFAEQILTDDVSRLVRDFQYRVVAGSARKPNKADRISRLTEFGQYFLPVAQQAMTMGVSRPLNAYMKAVGKAMELDVSEFMVTPEDEQLLQMQALPPPEEGAESSEGNG